VSRRGLDKGKGAESGIEERSGGWIGKGVERGVKEMDRGMGGE